MKGFDFPFDSWNKGLRPYKNQPKNGEYLLECFNLAPAEMGLEEHKIITSLAAEIDWGGTGQFTPSIDTSDRILNEVSVALMTSMNLYLETD